MQDQHDTIDLTDNSLTHVQNFPLLKRLTSLLLANNRISHISSSLSNSIPNLASLGLSNNALSELGDLVPLGELKRLEYLSLIGNAVTEKKWYREWVIFNCKTLRVLDFQRIQDKVCPICLAAPLPAADAKVGLFQERKHAKTLFLTPDGLPTALATSLQSAKAQQSSKNVASTEEEPTTAGAAADLAAGRAGRLMTAEEKARVKASILSATSAEEVRRLEKTLKEGWVPPPATAAAS